MWVLAEAVEGLDLLAHKVHKEMQELLDHKVQ
jgi:hypothetical protein